MGRKHAITCVCFTTLVAVIAVVWDRPPATVATASQRSSSQSESEVSPAQSLSAQIPTPSAAVTVTNPAAAITGTVLDPDDRPIGNAVVSWVATRSGVTGETRTDALGEFALSCEDRTSITLSSAHCIPQTRQRVRAGEHLTVRLQAGRALRGVVVDARTCSPPIAPTGTCFASWGLDGRSTRGIVNPDGTFRLDGLPTGTVRLEVVLQDYEVFARGGLTIGNTEPWVRCELEPARGVVGRVVSAADLTPIANASVTYVGEQTGRTREQRTDDQGAFRFDNARATRAIVEVQAAGFRAGRRHPRTTHGELVFELEPGRDDWLVTVHERGRPKANVRVLCTRGSHRETAISDKKGQVRFQDHGSDLPTQLRADSESRTARALRNGRRSIRLDLVEAASIVVKTTSGQIGARVLVETEFESVRGTIDATGTCRMIGLPPGGATVHLGEPPLHIGHVLLRPGRTHQIQVDSGEFHQLRMRIVDDRGRPVAGAPWTCRSSRTRRLGESSGHTDDAGEFTCTVSDEDAFVSISAPHFEFVENVRIAATEAMQQLALERVVTLHGVVEDRRTRRGVEQFEIVAADGTIVHRVWSPDGGFVLGLPREQQTTWIFRAPGYLPSDPIDVTASIRTPLVIELQPTGGIHGRVLDPQGRPAAGVDVILADPTRPAESEVGRTSTGVNGEFVFANADFGPHRVRVVVEEETLVEADTRVLDPTAAAEVDLHLPTLPTGHLLVFRPDGAPCVGATATWIRLGTNVPVATHSVHTDADGYASVPALLPGRYLVTTKLRTRGSSVETTVRMSDLEPFVQITLPHDDGT